MDPPPLRGVLVTGATTPVGERLVRRFLEDPRIQSVLAVAIQPEGLPFEDPRLTYRTVDLAHSRQTHELLFGAARDLGVEVIVHTSMHRSALDRGSRVRAQNVDALRGLMELAERHPTIRRLVVKSHCEVYQIQHDLPALITEDHPLNLQPKAPQWIRDRVEADLYACARMGMARLELCVLRMAEILAPGTGSQLFDYLEAPLALRPAGYDPMINVLSVDDAVEALERAARAFGVLGAFNVPGADTLPLSVCIQRWGTVGIPAPSAVITPVYRLRRRLRGHDFSYGMNRRRFHYASVLDGSLARERLGYVPSHPIDWPTG